MKVAVHLEFASEAEAQLWLHRYGDFDAWRRRQATENQQPAPPVPAPPLPPIDLLPRQRITAEPGF
jgi:hypothetical protein